MSKRLFVLLLSVVFAGSVVAEQCEMVSIVSPHGALNDQIFRLEDAHRTGATVSGVTAQIVEYDVNDEEDVQDWTECKLVGESTICTRYEVVTIKTFDQTSVEVALSGQDGRATIEISTKNPMLVEAFRTEKRLTEVVVELLRQLLLDNTKIVYEIKRSKYEESVAQAIADILKFITYAQELEGAQAIMKLYQDLAQYLCPKAKH